VPDELLVVVLDPRFRQAWIFDTVLAAPIFDGRVLPGGGFLGRLGAAFIYALEAVGAMVYEYSSKQLVDVSDPMKRTMLNLKFGFAAQESEAASARTTEQKVQRMAAGRLNDGRVLGYKTTGEAKKRVRVIDDVEAALVRRIFTLAAEGKGVLAIAKKLNDERVVNPTGQSRTFTDARSGVVAPKNMQEQKVRWSPMGIRGVLGNSLYIGQQVYGKTAWCWGDAECSRLGATLKSGAAPACKRHKHKYLVPESRWLTAERPDLRIVAQPLWDDVQARFSRSRALYKTRAGGTKPEGGIESKYLLSGFLVCAKCGGRMMVTKRTSKRGRPVHLLRVQYSPVAPRLLLGEGQLERRRGA
jgi:site-specific DNA recombinase